MTSSEYLDFPYDGMSVRLSVNYRPGGDHTIIFMHGLGCAKESFDAAFHSPRLKDFSLCAFDFPGHGESGRQNLSAYSLQAYADIANMLIDLLSPQRVSMVCHSMGGAVGLIASQTRKDLSWFMNIDGNLVREDCGIVSRNTARQPLQEFAATGFNEYLNGLLSSARADQKAWAKWYAQADPAALHEMARSLVDWSDSGKLLDMFTSLANKAYIYGSREIKDYLLPRLSSIPTYRIQNAGHFVMLDKPARLYRILGSMLARPAGAPPPISRCPEPGVEFQPSSRVGDAGLKR